MFQTQGVGENHMQLSLGCWGVLLLGCSEFPKYVVVLSAAPVWFDAEKDPSESVG